MFILLETIRGIVLNPQTGIFQVLCVCNAQCNMNIQRFFIIKKIVCVRGRCQTSLYPIVIYLLNDSVLLSFSLLAQFQCILWSSCACIATETLN